MIEHADYCPEKGDRRCDCDYEVRIRADEHARTEGHLREFADEVRAEERKRAASAVRAAAAAWDHQSWWVHRIFGPSIRAVYEHAAEVVEGGSGE